MSFSMFRMAEHVYEKLNDKDGKQPKPGDLIEVYRGMYRHWAVYIGGGKIVHFGSPGAGSGPSIMPVKGQKGFVLKENLKDVVEGFPWKINNLLDDKYKPRKDDDIVKEACARVGSSVTYDLINYNCEHFATELRYGKSESRQVKEAQQDGIMMGAIAAVGAVGVAALSIIGGLMRN